jgi:hypothetical protein
MPGDSGATVVTTVCTFLHTGCGCIGHPAFPTPSKGRRIFNGSGATRGEGAKLCLRGHGRNIYIAEIRTMAIEPGRSCLKNKQI